MGPGAQFTERLRHFRTNEREYTDARYKEASTRVEFIDPLLAALGWDLSNNKGLSERYKEVELEPSQESEGRQRNPDYAFRLSGIPKFFVEAKKPSIDISREPSPALQLRRYAWSAQLPLSILTNFRQLAIYDCRVQPHPSDSPHVQRLQLLHVHEYLANWDTLSSRFSREAVFDGRYDEYAREVPVDKKATQTVDAKFLADIQKWRKRLAEDIAYRNKSLSESALNFVVQATIDRIVFLRICEDRGIEPRESILHASRKADVYARLCELFIGADQRYNSGLFYFSEEKNRGEHPDRLSMSLEIGDEVLREMAMGLYPPYSPYEFSVIGADILGEVYEQFLGEVISLAKPRKVTIEAKPEVKKSSGVVYTPAWVVRNMVSEALGRLLADKRIGDVAGTAKTKNPLRIVDPACGSGSFLISVYDYLLAWYLEAYTANTDRWGRGREAKLYEAQPGVWKLTTAERKRILLDHIFGVDIDPQAVEVTKLSLLLKVLEGESSASLERQLALFHERALPDLGRNIKCGNALVGYDLLDVKPANVDGRFLESEANVLDWADEFPAVMSTGGFDLVIGNPPYLSYSGRQAIDMHPVIRTYLEGHYDTSGWPTSHAMFMERAAKLLTKDAVSFIVPDQVGHLAGYSVARKAVTEHGSLVSVRYLGEDVFHGRTTPALTFLSVSDPTDTTEVYARGDSVPTHVVIRNDEPWVPGRGAIVDRVLDKIAEGSWSLGSLVGDPGVHTGNCSKKLILPLEEATADSVPVLEGRNVVRYGSHGPCKVLRLGYSALEDEYFTIRPEAKYSSAAYVIRQTASEPIVGPREGAVYFRNSLLALYDPDDETDVRYVVALLNSTLLRWAYRESVTESGQKAFPQVKVRALRSIPIRTLDHEDETDRGIHNQIVELAQQMLDLNRDTTGAALSPPELRRLETRIAATDRELDQIIYGLYGLEQSEIDVITSRYQALCS